MYTTAPLHAYTVTLRTARGTEQIMVPAINACDAIIRATRMIGEPPRVAKAELTAPAKP